MLYDIKVFLIKHSFCARLVIPKFSAMFRSMGWSPGLTNAEDKEIRSNGRFWQKAQEDIVSFKRECHDIGIQLVIVLFPSMMNYRNHPAKGTHIEIRNGAWSREFL